jgi:hypothetical protein
VIFLIWDPHVPHKEDAARPDGTFSRADLIFDQERNIYIAQVVRS